VPGENLWDGRTLASLTDAAIYIAFIFRRIEMAGINPQSPVQRRTAGLGTRNRKLASTAARAAPPVPVENPSSCRTKKESERAEDPEAGDLRKAGRDFVSIEPVCGEACEHMCQWKGGIQFLPALRDSATVGGAADITVNTSSYHDGFPRACSMAPAA